MASEQYSSLLILLQQQLDAARAQDMAMRSENVSGSIIRVTGTGKAISAAYEQLRNAAEYTEEHLLLQRAIRRFYKRSFSFLLKRHIPNIGEEIIVELTQAGYLPNESYSAETANRITQLAETYMQVYPQLRQSHVSRDDALDWVLSILSVETEGILNPHSHLTALAYGAYQHYVQLFPRDRFTATEQEMESYDVCLYIAVHQALLKSDVAIVRHELMRMYQQTPAALHEFITFNQNVGQLYAAPLTQRLKRAVSKHAAPFRVLKSMAEERPDLTQVLADRTLFLSAYDQQTNKEYKLISARLNKGIVKSIIFIFITKVLIGVSIEVPYDLIVVGTISFLPLGINLLFPPLYMASLKLGLKAPSQANAQSLHNYIDKIFYSDDLPLLSPRDVTKTASAFTKWLYSILFLIPFAIMVYVLILLRFNPVQAIIFFVFLSTASFLGFRLSSMIRELELVNHEGRLLITVRDFFYLPFILVGQWLSSKYAKINAVANVLDIVIELPLKTVLRLLRQWTRFLNEKHDQIY